MQDPLAPRRAGILLHPTSLPGIYGSGDIGQQARNFIDWMKDAGFSWWQMLPIHPSGAACSPYDSASAFAGGEHLISLDEMVEWELLNEDQLEGITRVHTERQASLEKGAELRQTLLRRAFERFERSGSRELRFELEQFLTLNESWVWDYALFVTLREKRTEATWTEWPVELRSRNPAAVRAARREHEEDIRFRVFNQFVFERQWQKLRQYARERGIFLMGDLPMFVAHDSVDVWCNQDKFFLNAAGERTVQAGVPPDYFSETGQLWGNPLYRWEALRDDGYGWWVERLRRELIRFDAVRLDHFIAFSRYWEVPMGAETAQGGTYVNGPAHDFFEAARHSLGHLPFVAEDLGVITPEVEQLRDHFGLPGMKVMHFGFAPGAEAHLPHGHPERAVAYLGTHDNDTTAGWLAANLEAKDQIEAYVSSHPGASTERKCIASLMHSRANLIMLTPQDILEESSEHRMNVPGVADGNWRYRLDEASLTKELAAEMHELVDASGRSA